MPEIKTWRTTKKKEASKTQQPKCRFWPNPSCESFRWWKSDRTCGFLPPLQWKKEATMQKPSNPGTDYQTQVVSRWLPNSSDGNQIGHTVSLRRSNGGKRTRWRVGLIFCFGFDLFMGFWGLEVESGTTFGEKGKEDRKKSMFWLNWNRVQRAQFPLNKTESFGLDFHGGKASPFCSISSLRGQCIQLSCCAMGNRVQYTRFIHQNRVLWTQFVKYQNSFKPWLTNNTIWIL